MSEGFNSEDTARVAGDDDLLGAKTNLENHSPIRDPTDMEYESYSIASLVSRKSIIAFRIPGLNPAHLPLSELDPELFERVVAELVSRRDHRGVQFFGRRGQAQYGLDIVELNPQHEYRLYQVKRYSQLSPSEIDGAIRAYAGDPRPPDYVGPVRRFNPREFVLVTSAEFDSETRNVEQLRDLRTKYAGDLDIEVWGAEALNRKLRDAPRLVYAVFGSAWAKAFCGFDPSPQEQALPEALGYVEDPVEILGLAHLVNEARAIEETSPATAANLYRTAADSLQEEGFPGHANLLRRSEAKASRAAHEMERAFDVMWALALDQQRVGEGVDPNTIKDLQEVAEGDKVLLARIGTLAHAWSWPEGGTDLPSVLPSLRILVEAKDRFAPILCCITLESAVTDGLFLFVPPRSLVGTTDDYSGALLEELLELTVASKTDDRELRARLHCALADSSLVASATVEQVQKAYDQLTKDAAAGLYWTSGGLIAARAARQFALHGDTLHASNLWRQAILASSEAGFFGDARGSLRAMNILNSESGEWKYSYLREIVSAMPNRKSLLSGTHDPFFNALSAAHNGKLPDAFADARRALLQATLSGHLVEELLAHEMFGDVLSAAGHFGPAVNQYVLASKSDKAVNIAKHLQVEADVREWIDISLRSRREAAIQVLAAQTSLIPDEQVADRVDELLKAATGVWNAKGLGPRPERKALDAVSDFGIRIPETAIDQILELAEPARVGSTGISDTIATLVVNAFWAVSKRRQDLSEAIIDMLKLPDPPHNLWSYLHELVDLKQSLLPTVIEMSEQGNASAIKVLASWGECTPTVQLAARRACSTLLRNPMGLPRTQGSIGTQDSTTVGLLLTLLNADPVVDFDPQEFSADRKWSGGGVFAYMQGEPATGIERTASAESEPVEVLATPEAVVDDIARICATPPRDLAIEVGRHLLAASEDNLDFGFARVQSLEALRLMIDHLPCELASEMVPRLMAIHENPQHSAQDKFEMDNLNPLSRFRFDFGTGQLSILALIVAATALKRGTAGEKLNEQGLKIGHRMFAAALPMLAAGSKHALYAAAAVLKIALADPELAILALVLVGSPDENIRALGVLGIPIDDEVVRQIASDPSREVRKALATRALELPIETLELLERDIDLQVRLVLEDARNKS